MPCASGSPMKPSLFTTDEAVEIKGACLRLVSKSDEFAASLYKHLFARAPGVRDLFAPSMDEQYYKLVRMLSVMVDSVDDPFVFEAECRASGDRHRHYGAVPAHYEVLGAALMDALREIDPPSPDEERLWLRLYGGATRTTPRRAARGGRVG